MGERFWSVEGKNVVLVLPDGYVVCLEAVQPVIKVLQDSKLLSKPWFIKAATQSVESPLSRVVRTLWLLLTQTLISWETARDGMVGSL